MKKFLTLAACLALPALAALSEERFFGDIIDYGAEYLSPEYISVSESGTVAIGCKTGDCVVFLKNGKVAGKVDLGARVSGVKFASGGILYATTLGENGKLRKIDAKNFREICAFDVGHFPTAPEVSKDGKSVYIANQFTNAIRKIDAESGKELAAGQAVHEPYAMKLTPDGKELVIANHLPEPKGGLYVENIGCAITVLDAETLKTLAKIELPNGAINCKDIVISKDGKTAYATYVLARFNVPTTQLERGWVNTNAVAIIDLKNRKRLASFLLDENTLGAAYDGIDEFITDKTGYPGQKDCYQ